LLVQTYLSGYGVDGAVAKVDYLTSSLSNGDWAPPGGLITLLAWLGSAECGLPRFECRSKVPDLRHL
jgi:hypothetical protein